MLRAHSLVLVLGLTFTQGCAYKSAMRRGDDAARAGDWLAAHAAYQEAFNRKQHAEAAQAAETAKGEAIEDLYAKGREAAAAGDFDSAAASYNRMKELAGADEPTLVELRKEIRDELLATMDEKLALDPKGAYQSALRVATLFKPELLAEEALDKVRTHFRTEADKFAEEGRYGDAIGSLNVIIEREPEQKDVLAVRFAEISVAWADSLSTEAYKKWNAGARGAAAVLQARAYEVANREKDLEHARNNADALKHDARLKYYLKIEGDWKRMKDVRDGLRERLETPALARGGETGSNLTVTLNLGDRSCKETKVATPIEKEYVSGKVDVPSPEHQALQEKMAAAEKDHAAAQAELEKLNPALQKAKDALADAQADGATAIQARDDARKTLDRANANLATQKDLFAKAEAELAAAADDAAKKAAKDKVAVMGANVKEWEEEVTEWTQKLKDAEAKAATADSASAPQLEKLKVVQGDYDKVAARRDAAKQQINDLNAQLARTPRLVSQDVKETFAYDREEWTRTCRAPTTGLAWQDWKSQVDKKRSWDPVREAKDTANKGNEAAGVPVDKKAYATTEEADLEAIEGEVVAGVAEWVNARVKEYFDTGSQQIVAKMGKSPDAATNELVSLYAAAAEFLPESAITAFKQHVKQHYGLEKLELLRRPADGAADPAAPAPATP